VITRRARLRLEKIERRLEILEPVSSRPISTIDEVIRISHEEDPQKPNDEAVSA